MEWQRKCRVSEVEQSSSREEEWVWGDNAPERGLYDLHSDATPLRTAQYYSRRHFLHDNLQANYPKSYIVP